MVQPPKWVLGSVCSPRGLGACGRQRVFLQLTFKGFPSLNHSFSQKVLWRWDSGARLNETWARTQLSHDLGLLALIQNQFDEQDN